MASGALCPGSFSMSLPDSPPSAATRHLDSQAAFAALLSEFQADAAHLQPVLPRLPDVLAAALPAFQLGFSYSSSFWNGELTVTLQHGCTETASRSGALTSSYTETAARLLAGLLGIPLVEGGPAPEAEMVATAPAVVHPIDAAPAAEPPAAAPAAAPEPEPAPEPVAFPEPAPEPPAPALAVVPPADIHRPLSESERESAIGMIRTMPVDVRKAFTRVFREEFQVPAEAKQVAPYICELRHLQFVDRFTVEAAGGIAAA